MNFTVAFEVVYTLLLKGIAIVVAKKLVLQTEPSGKFSGYKWNLPILYMRDDLFLLTLLAWHYGKKKIYIFHNPGVGETYLMVIAYKNKH